jgi:hypothetical protein
MNTIRLLVASILAFAAPAFADEIRIVSSATPIVVHADDTLLTAKPLVQPKDADGNLIAYQPSGAYINRADGKGFYLNGATKLRAAGWVSGKGYVYAPVDAPAAPAATPPVVTPPAPIVTNVLYGINLSGGEFSGVENGSLLPNPEDMQAYYDAGFKAFRIPFKMKQVQSAPAKLKAIGAKCVQLAVPCIFDRHEYDWRKVPGSVPEWKALLALMPASDLIQIDPMNEPAWFDSLKITNNWDQWAVEAQQWVTDMRAAGITSRLWLEYPGVSAAFRFDKGERKGKACESAACALRKLPGGTIHDPLNRTGLNAHRYFDKNGNGGTDYCRPTISLLDFANKAKPFGLPVVVTEVAFGSNRGIRAQCQPVGRAALAEIAAAPNLYAVTWWGGGRAWKKDYLFYTPPMATLPYVKMITGR